MRTTLAWSLVMALAAVACAGDSMKPPAKWKGHEGNLPFIMGYENGLKVAAFTGRPPMFFYTAIW